MPETIPLYTFGNEAAAMAWRPVNDVVMGGVSSSTLTFEPPDRGVFAGVVSFENNGGFASVHGPQLTQDLTGIAALLLRVRGDGKRYRFSVRTRAAFDAVQYHAMFTAGPGDWQTLRFPLSAFGPRLRGRDVSGAPPLAGESIAAAGFLIADRQEGAFRLEINAVMAER